MITDDFIHKLILRDSSDVLVFVSGLGLNIRNQREVFIRKYALKNSMSYIAFDCTQNAYKQEASPAILFDKMKQTAKRTLQENFSNKSFYFVGSCFGANLSMYLANQFSEQTKLALISSPLIQYGKEPVCRGLCTQLEKKIKFLSRRNIDAEIISKLVLLKSFFQEVESLLTPSVNTYTGPIIILHPENDKSVNFDNSLHMCEMLNRQNVELVQVPNETHSFRNDFQLKNVLSYLHRQRQKTYS
ncbi:MAG: hypothetical protein IJC11_00315 [Alphaproteobacteria bacterium]|nr:hypothetical protein [Alphaproteobacteria bacterium]